MSARRRGARRPAVTPRPRLRRADIPLGARVFANRNLKMARVKVIGFDMDHTLAIYRPIEFETLAFREARRKLVEDRGYPEETLSAEYDHDFVIRGLVVDKRLGNIIKMDRHQYVLRAYHGTTCLSSAKRKELYAGRKIPLSSPDYTSVDTLFSLPEVALYAQLVDLLERRNGRRAMDYYQLYTDVRSCVDEAHADGSIKSVIARDPERFVVPDEYLALTLDKLRRHGKRVFLLTNSDPAYTDVVLGVLLNGQLHRYGSWRDYFDIVVVSALKPAFFVSDAPFVHADGPHKGRPALPGEKGKVFQGGNARDFLARMTCRSDEILYFGDHTYGDILRSKRTSGWRTAMIIQELESELDGQQRARPHLKKALDAERLLDRLISDRDLLEIELAAHEKRILDAGQEPVRAARSREERRRLKRGLRALDARIARAERDMEASREAAEDVYNRYWGQLFKHGTTTSRFGAQVARFACIYMCRASSLFYYPVNKFYKPPREFLPHEHAT
jgi:HAD superfamily 5'-nucleotidase-like hydrolase